MIDTAFQRGHLAFRGEKNAKYATNSSECALFGLRII
jgi:hypothetical protein